MNTTPDIAVRIITGLSPLLRNVVKWSDTHYDIAK